VVPVGHGHLREIAPGSDVCSRFKHAEDYWVPVEELPRCSSSHGAVTGWFRHRHAEAAAERSGQPLDSGSASRPSCAAPTALRPPYDVLCRRCADSMPPVIHAPRHLKHHTCGMDGDKVACRDWAENRQSSGAGRPGSWA
jgi:hypothetical protein